MKLILRYPDATEAQIIHLKSFLSHKHNLADTKIDVNRHVLNEGEMGAGGITDSLTAIISAATEPLTELVKCLQEYIKNFKGDIEIIREDKTVIKISGRPNKNMQQLIKQILDSDTSK